MVESTDPILAFGSKATVVVLPVVDAGIIPNRVYGLPRPLPSVPLVNGCVLSDPSVQLLEDRPLHSTKPAGLLKSALNDPAGRQCVPTTIKSPGDVSKVTVAPSL